MQVKTWWDETTVKEDNLLRMAERQIPAEAKFKTGHDSERPLDLNLAVDLGKELVGSLIDVMPTAIVISSLIDDTILYANA